MNTSTRALIVLIVMGLFITETEAQTTTTITLYSESATTSERYIGGGAWTNTELIIGEGGEAYPFSIAGLLEFRWRQKAISPGSVVTEVKVVIDGGVIYGERILKAVSQAGSTSWENPSISFLMWRDASLSNSKTTIWSDIMALQGIDLGGGEKIIYRDFAVKKVILKVSGAYFDEIKVSNKLTGLEAVYDLEKKILPTATVTATATATPTATPLLTPTPIYFSPIMEMETEEGEIFRIRGSVRIRAGEIKTVTVTVKHQVEIEKIQLRKDIDRPAPVSLSGVTQDKSGLYTALITIDARGQAPQTNWFRPEIWDKTGEAGYASIYVTLYIDADNPTATPTTTPTPIVMPTPPSGVIVFNIVPDGLWGEGAVRSVGVRHIQIAANEIGIATVYVEHIPKQNIVAFGTQPLTSNAPVYVRRDIDPVAFPGVGLFRFVIEINSKEVAPGDFWFRIFAQDGTGYKNQTDILLTVGEIISVPTVMPSSTQTIMPWWPTATATPTNTSTPVPWPTNTPTLTSTATPTRLFRPLFIPEDKLLVVDSLYFPDATDLSGGVDIDEAGKAELGIWYRVPTDDIISDIHLYMSRDGEELIYIGRTGNGWQDHMKATSQYIKVGHFYGFRVYFVRPPGYVPRVAGFIEAKPVLVLAPYQKVPTATPTATIIPTPTYTLRPWWPTATPTITAKPTLKLPPAIESRQELVVATDNLINLESIIIDVDGPQEAKEMVIWWEPRLGGEKNIVNDYYIYGRKAPEIDWSYIMTQSNTKEPYFIFKKGSPVFNPSWFSEGPKHGGQYQFMIVAEDETGISKKIVSPVLGYWILY